MRINISNAVKQFFPNPSLEQVYFEAVANSLDAGATEIGIKISLASFQDSDSLKISISDNGEGFTDARFDKFSKLLENEDPTHKGLGRLVYLNYFRKIEISSVHGQYLRNLTFSDSFDGESENIALGDDAPEQETSLHFTGHRKSKIKSYDYVRASSIKEKLLTHFFPQFHRKKIKQDPLKITIEVETDEESQDYDFKNETTVIDVTEIPDLECETFTEGTVDLFEEFTLYYSVSKNTLDPDPITAIIADNRTIPIDLFKGASLPGQYAVVFLLYSSYFDGKVNPSRQKLDLPDHEMAALKQLLTKKIGTLLKEKLPAIDERNETIYQGLNNRYPHLTGYFDKDTIALVDRPKVLEKAQRHFFQDQRKILDAESLDDETFQKSLELSSRTLTEYILYRQKIIERLRSMSPRNTESDIHNLMIPMRTTLRGENMEQDLHANNVWLLDDKYMSYQTILSDEKMSDLMPHIKLEGEDIEKDDSRPDISLVFSNDPDNPKAKVDVVIVEIKRMGITHRERLGVYLQLQERARRLLDYFPDRINRIWFYGVIDFDLETEMALLDNGFQELFSKGKVLYQEQSIRVYPDPNKKVPASFYIVDFKALIEDANTRNATFLEILKKGMQRYATNDS